MLEQEADEPIEVEAEVEATEVEPAPVETDDDEIVVTIGEDTTPVSTDEDGPEFIKTLRRKAREADALRKRVQELESQTQPKADDLGEKPTLESCDYDEDAFAESLSQWMSQKAEHDRKVQEQANQARTAQEAFEAQVKTFETQKAEFSKVKGWEAAETAFAESFSEQQQALLVKVAPEKALLVFALGSNADLRTKLSSIKDPLDFVFAAGQLSKDIKMERRKPATTPETTVTPSAPLLGSDKKLAQLEAEAERTGDRTALIRYRKQMQKAG